MKLNKNNEGRIIAMNKQFKDEITKSINMGYDEIKVGMISPNKKGVMLVNAKYQVRGKYPLELQNTIQSMINKIASESIIPKIRKMVREELHRLNEDNPTINKKVRDLLTAELKDLSNGGPDLQFAIMHILIGALTDANFHPEAKKVESIFRKAEYGGDSKSEATDIKKYQYTIGTKIANMCDWDGRYIVNAIGFYTSMTVGRPAGERVAKLVETMNKLTENIRSLHAIACEVAKKVKA